MAEKKHGAPRPKDEAGKSEKPSPAELERKAREQPEQTGDGANIRQNTTHQGYQQDR